MCTAMRVHCKVVNMHTIAHCLHQIVQNLNCSQEIGFFFSFITRYHNPFSFEFSTIKYFLDFWQKIDKKLTLKWLLKCHAKQGKTRGVPGNPVIKAGLSYNHYRISPVTELLFLSITLKRFEINVKNS